MTDWHHRRWIWLHRKVSDVYKIRTWHNSAKTSVVIYLRNDHRSTKIFDRVCWSLNHYDLSANVSLKTVHCSFDRSFIWTSSVKKNPVSKQFQWTIACPDFKWWTSQISIRIVRQVVSSLLFSFHSVLLSDRIPLFYALINQQWTIYTAFINCVHSQQYTPKTTNESSSCSIASTFQCQK